MKESFWVEPGEGTLLKHNKDLLIGFYSTRDMDLKMSIGTDFTVKIPLKSDHFVRAPFSLLPLRTIVDDIRIGGSITDTIYQIYIVYVKLPIEISMEMWRTIQRVEMIENEKIIVKYFFRKLFHQLTRTIDGFMLTGKTIDDEIEFFCDIEILYFPFIPSELYKEKYTHQFTKAIKDEMMEVAWNPNRLRWVFDIHEAKRCLS